MIRGTRRWAVSGGEREVNKVQLGTSSFNLFRDLTSNTSPSVLRMQIYNELWTVDYGAYLRPSMILYHAAQFVQSSVYKVNRITVCEFAKLFSTIPANSI